MFSRPHIRTFNPSAALNTHTRTDRQIFFFFPRSIQDFRGAQGRRMESAVITGQNDVCVHKGHLSSVSTQSQLHVCEHSTPAESDSVGIHKTANNDIWSQH